MRLIDVDAITDDEIISYLGIRYASCKEDIRDMLDEQPTIDETEIIRKAFERVVDRLELLKYRHLPSKTETIKKAIEIVKEECGISE